MKEHKKSIVLPHQSSNFLVFHLSVISKAGFKLLKQCVKFAQRSWSKYLPDVVLALSLLTFEQNITEICVYQALQPAQVNLY